MRFDFALLADAAMTAEGKLFVLGGGLTRVTPPRLPWIQNLAVAARLLADPGDDPAALTTINVTVTGPDGMPVFPQQPIQLTGQRPTGTPIEGEGEAHLLALALNGIAFFSEGLHRVELALPDHEIAIGLAVVLQQQAPQ